MFGGPPITVILAGRPVQVALEGPAPHVKIGEERRLDLLAGRITMIIDATSVVPVYLDLKLQHFELDRQVFSLQFKDSLRTVVIDGLPYTTDFGGLPMAIQLNGRKHFVRFSSLPQGVRPGHVLVPLAHGAPMGFGDRPPVDSGHQDQLTAAAPKPVPLDIGELLNKLMSTGLLPGSGTVPDSSKLIVKEEIKKEEPVKRKLSFLFSF